MVGGPAQRPDTDPTVAENFMAHHLYRVGQTVDFNPNMRSGVPASGRAYKILKLLPHETGECTYRIKTIAEQFERVAKESELALSTGKA
jgi:hypothetical protein